MQERIGILLGSLLMLCGCASEAPSAMNYSLAVDPDFTLQQMVAVDAAIRDWNGAVPGLRIDESVATCTSPAPHQICFHPEFASTADAAGDLVGTTYLGDSDSANVLIYIDRIAQMPEDTQSLTEQTAAHELGHALGLQHTGPGTLMAPYVAAQAQTVTETDVAQFWAVRGR